MRWLVGSVLLISSCTQIEPLGVYRLPLPVASGVELRTVLARSEGVALVLFDGRDGHELGRTEATMRWDGQPVPFRVESIDLTLYVRDGIIEDRSSGKYTKVPCAPLVVDVDSVRRVTLASGGRTREFVVAGETVFTESSEAQPAKGEVPDVLALLGSVAGVGLWLPGALVAGDEWRDEMTTRVPPDPSQPVACGAPLASVVRVQPSTLFELPAGRIRAIPTVELVDTCRQTAAPALEVFAYGRAWAVGLGPVRLDYTGSDNRTWQYVLVASDVGSGGGAIWPLSQGNRWVFEKRDPDGLPVGAPVEVVVQAERVVEPVAP